MKPLGPVPAFESARPLAFTPFTPPLVILPPAGPSSSGRATRSPTASPPPAPPGWPPSPAPTRARTTTSGRSSTTRDSRPGGRSRQGEGRGGEREGLGLCSPSLILLCCCRCYVAAYLLPHTMQADTLWVLDQLPGTIVASDHTGFLLPGNQTYWASYNRREGGEGSAFLS